jgi:hypothetical protein
MILAFLLVPVGSWAATSFPQVFITDPDAHDHKAHVDAAGNPQVMGDLNVANTPTVDARQAGDWSVGIEGAPSVNVGNFPSTQDVNLARGSLAVIDRIELPVAFHIFEPGESQSESFETIDATSIVITKPAGTEMSVSFDSPVQPGFLPLLNDDDGSLPIATYSFPDPVPINGATVHCQNESDTCIVDIAIIGF